MAPYPLEVVACRRRRGLHEGLQRRSRANDAGSTALIATTPATGDAGASSSLFDELMAWQLRNLQAHLSAYSGDLLHREITTCTDSRIKTINQWAGAHASSVKARLRRAQF